MAPGLRGEKLPFEGCRILSSGRNIFIVGHDVPDGKEEWQRCISEGTFFGTMTFLEGVVGARWLMPGEWGEDVPRRDELSTPPLDVTEAPFFPFRCLTYVQGRYNEQVKLWKRRHKVHVWYRVSFGHSFDAYPPRAVLEKRPEFMPMRDDGTREPLPPAGERHNYKLCLTNPGLVRAFGEAIVAWLDKRPTQQHASMSPSDGAGFCQCPECRKLTLADDGGKWGDFAERGWSCTPAVLQFYNGVARVVAEKYPDRMVGGLIYHAYTYPPDEPVPMAPNVVLNLAVLDAYGYKLYKPERAREFRLLFPAWSKFTKRLACTDYSTWMRDWYGIPLPPGRKILELIFPILREHKTVFVNYTGHAAWGSGAVHNYVVAKLLWRPDADVDALYHEFLERAYGPDAAPYVDRLYTISADELARYIRSHPGHRQPSYDASHELVATAYAPHFAEFEALYAKALEAAGTEARRKRLGFLGDALTLLHYNLRRAGLAQDPERSIFYKPEAEFSRFMAERAQSLSLAPAMKPAPGKTPRFLYAPEDRKVLIPLLPADVTPPKIDGDLSDTCWTRAGVADGFRLRGTRTPAEQQTAVRFSFDRKTLYIAIECRDDRAREIATTCASDDSVGLFTDDTVELFLGHRPNYHETYWQIAFNPAGARYDAVVKERDYDLALTSAAKIGTGAWTVEIAIPFTSFRLDSPPFGKTWRGNIGRCRKPAPREVSTWSGIEEGFHDPKTFGDWTFADE